MFNKPIVCTRPLKLTHVQEPRTSVPILFSVWISNPRRASVSLWRLQIRVCTVGNMLWRMQECQVNTYYISGVFKDCYQFKCHNCFVNPHLKSLEVSYYEGCRNVLWTLTRYLVLHSWLCPCIYCTIFFKNVNLYVYPHLKSISNVITGNFTKFVIFHINSICHKTPTID